MTQTKKAKEKTMRAVALDRFGGPETLKVQTVPIPEAGADEILIHVEGAGVFSTTARGRGRSAVHDAQVPDHARERRSQNSSAVRRELYPAQRNV